ncbi:MULTISPECIES: CopG family ribbon-helix-helix protein [Halococcus]|uniref:CopG family transcripitonal regulator n=1 Tax=Halococcus salifodinae DSM 8989 TaxID=1227456 RepID=M0NEF5_9EURY|nr:MULTISPECIES: CopG family ribbon-helix-helix protein [Halococcus]EMA55938.1 CopG family transcripitonal regulator [Halococcus salifodinae DSM 8989]
MEIVSVSMTDSLLDRIDGFADDHDYAGRSEVVREAARALLGEFEDDPPDDSELMGVVTAVFEYNSPQVEERMMDLRHEHDDLLSSNAHNCVGEKRGCMESFVLEGHLEDISTFVRKVRAVDEALTVEYSLIPIDTIGETITRSRS